MTLNGEKVGTATLVRRGLYYDVICCCHTAGDQMLHLLVETTNSMENLGLLIPVSGRLELKKQISAKRMGKGKPAFFLQVRQMHTAEFFPVHPEEPFPGLPHLEEYTFAVRNGQIGVELNTKNCGKKLQI